MSRLEPERSEKKTLSGCDTTFRICQDDFQTRLSCCNGGTEPALQIYIKAVKQQLLTGIAEIVIVIFSMIRRSTLFFGGRRGAVKLE